MTRLVNWQKYQQAECFFYDRKDGFPAFPSLALRDCNDVCNENTSLDDYAEYVRKTILSSFTVESCTTPGMCQYFFVIIGLSIVWKFGSFL